MAKSKSSPEPATETAEDEHLPEPAVPRETQSPEPVLSGRFKLYRTPDGGMHVSWHTDQHGEGHKEVSPMMLKMLGAGPLARLFKG